jgi:hypothetical protein
MRPDRDPTERFAAQVLGETVDREGLRLAPLSGGLRLSDLEAVRVDAAVPPDTLTLSFTPERVRAEEALGALEAEPVGYHRADVAAMSGEALITEHVGHEGVHGGGQPLLRHLDERPLISKRRRTAVPEDRCSRLQFAIFDSRGQEGKMWCLTCPDRSQKRKTQEGV